MPLTVRRVLRGSRSRSCAIWALVLAIAARGVAFGVAGDLDPGFGTDGIAILDFGSNEQGGGLAVQPDGKIVVVGASGSSTVIARLDANGMLDPGFGSGGRAVPMPGGLADVVIQSDGKIVAAGTANQNFIVDRVDSSGQYDSALFGVGGRATIDFGGFAGASAVRVLGLGSIFVAGVASSRVALARLLQDGSLDPLFGMDFPGPGKGKATGMTGFGLGLETTGALESTKLLVPVAGGGMSLDTFALDGSPVSGFGTAGRATVAAGDNAYAVGVLGDGTLFLLGATGATGATNMVFGWLNPDGSPNASFGNLGTAAGGSGSGAALALQADGKVVITVIPDGDEQSVRITVDRYLPDGSYDQGFGAGGRVVIPGAPSVAAHVALQTDGNIVVVGTIVSGGQADIAVVRLQGATVTTPPPSDHTIPVKLAAVKPLKFVKLVAKGTFTLPDRTVDDPTQEGGALTVAGTLGSVTYPLAANAWRALGKHADGSKGYRFEGSPCQSVVLKPKVIKAVCKGDTGTFVVPEPGPVDVVLTIGSRTTRYCGQCGGTAKGNAGAIFKRATCAAPAGCP